MARKTDDEINERIAELEARYLKFPAPTRMSNEGLMITQRIFELRWALNGAEV